MNPRSHVSERLTTSIPAVSVVVLVVSAVILGQIGANIDLHQPDGTRISNAPASADRKTPADQKKLVQWRNVEDFERSLAQYPTVFWEPLDTESLRDLIRSTPLVRGKRVLEIGTGTGLIALCCLKAGASHVVATDVNQWALDNVRFNKAELKLDGELETRLVSLANGQFGDSSGAFAVIGPDERFDVIISNPPWENSRPNKIDDFALYDENFRLMQSLLDELPKHLNPNGRCLLVYGCVSAIRELIQRAGKLGFDSRVLDDRQLDELPEVFLPGMLIEIIVAGSPN